MIGNSLKEIIAQKSIGTCKITWSSQSEEIH